MIDVTQHGAVGDGHTLNTTAIQQCIDLCHEKGGGEVRMPCGVFVSGTVRLRSGVALHLEQGAVLQATSNLEDFPSRPSVHPNYEGEFETHKALILAEDADRIGIFGMGTIDGGGTHWKEGPSGFPSFSARPRIIYFRNCNGVRIRDIVLLNGASWIQTYQSCCDVVIDGITVDSRENPDIEKERFADHRHLNSDGLDLVDSQQVRISNCFIRAGDDGICLKSFSPNEACRDITIANCVITTNASGIKIGTESAGAFEDITISNCTIYDTRCEGISILSTDGARVERLIISNISMRNIKGGPIVIRLGNRHRSYRKEVVAGPGAISDVMIQNIQGSRLAAPYACSISGYPDHPVRRVVLDGVHLAYDGGFDEEIPEEIPENSSDYPGGRMFGKLPVHGLFARHVDDLTLRGVKVRTALPDSRTAFRFEKVTDLTLIDTPGAEQT